MGIDRRPANERKRSAARAAEEKSIAEREEARETIARTRHQQAGVPLLEWLEHRELFPKEPISLMDIDAMLREAFCPAGQLQWQEGMKLCIAALIRHGWQQMLYDKDSQSWQWSNRLTWPEEFGEGPEAVAEATLLSWMAFGDSGGAEDLRFAKVLPSPQLDDSDDASEDRA